MYVREVLLEEHVQSTADTHGGQTGHAAVVLTASLWRLLLNVDGLLRIHGLWRRSGVAGLLLLVALVVALLVALLALLWIVAALVVVSLVVVALLLVPLVVVSVVSSLVSVDGWGSCWGLC